MKQFEEETQLRVFLVLDMSASMVFRSRAEVMMKIEFARIVVAATALLAQRQGDAFGLGLVGAELESFLAARSSQPHWQVFIGQLESMTPGGETSLAKALGALAEVVPPRSMIVVVSDFYEDLEALRAALRRLHYDHHELVGLHVLDPQEADFDLNSAGTFVDLETDARLALEAPAARSGYLERFNAFCTDLEEIFRNAGGEMARLLERRGFSAATAGWRENPLCGDGAGAETAGGHSLGTPASRGGRREDRCDHPPL